MRAVTGRMCLLKRANLPGAILTKLFFKDTVFRRCLQYANLNGSVLRRVVLDGLTGFRIERMQGAGLTAASGGFNRDELL